jgi:hypothetical protein
MPRNPRHSKLLEDPDVRRWYEGFDSQKTAKDRLRQLGLFCERMGTPKAYARMSVKAYTDLLQDYCAKWPGETVKKAVVAWLGHWGRSSNGRSRSRTSAATAAARGGPWIRARPGHSSNGRRFRINPFGGSSGPSWVSPHPVRPPWPD